MLVAAAVCPCPPLLVPAVAAGAAGELEALRTACGDALEVLAQARPDRLVVVGPRTAATDPGGAGDPENLSQGTRGSFRDVGVDLDVRLGDAQGAASERKLPPSLAVAAWLLEAAGWSAAPVEGLAVDEHLGRDRCAEAGRKCVRGPARVALLIMGDGSACRNLKAPGYLDERAAGFDARAAQALGSADTGALLALDEGLARELLVAGRAPWQVLAGAGEGTGLNGKLLHDAAPYGVGYFTAVWS
ncbi:class III extradiol dioxygenase subunit B-like domain-containing protein [Streptomyces meridianus]|uniref:Class III extradiol dioxygenase subunit B-like domain-containing protein n=1 Tax=Streptomyces meridianus TaxID=2938945 RepID=A0ABT0X943_9ACTN|nr:class III extradiol dioxygenase subunit B-like domain-containing protein [Streptomyces meridianus]MCM2578805.1 class III extradiol dioxygenase subunit B-like domain-containing protein [Streptomyces meridianus]